MPSNEPIWTVRQCQMLFGGVSKVLAEWQSTGSTIICIGPTLEFEGLKSVYLMELCDGRWFGKTSRSLVPLQSTQERWLWFGQTGGINLGLNDPTWTDQIGRFWWLKISFGPTDSPLIIQWTTFIGLTRNITSLKASDLTEPGGGEWWNVDCRIRSPSPSLKIHSFGPTGTRKASTRRIN